MTTCSTANNRQPRCYILGAGASRNAGYPLVDCIIALLDEWLSRRDAAEFRDEQGQDNKDDSRVLSLYRDKLHPLIIEIKKDLPNDGRNNIEKILEALKNRDKDSYLLFEKILYWMFFHMGNHPEVYCRGYFKTFVKKLTVKDTIISFNYDLLLEWTLKELSISYTLNWNDPTKIKILKPHGSIGLINNLSPQTDVGIRRSDNHTSSLKAADVFTNLNEDFQGALDMHDHWDIFRHKIPQVNSLYWDQFNSTYKHSFLVLPEMNKKNALQEDQNAFLNMMWDTIPSILPHYKEFWVIGYRFADNDDLAISRIGRYLKESKSKAVVVSLKKNSTFLEEFTAMQHVNYYPMEFKKFVRLL